MRNLTWLLVALTSLPALALTNVDVYSTVVIVEPEAPNSDEVARQQGMTEVLVRASGNQNIASNAVIKKALGQSSRYISQLGYTQKQGQQALRVRFNSDQIQVLLKQAEQSTWPAERKNVMVWLVQDSGYDREILWEHSDSTLIADLKQEAQRRGLPVTLPIGDFDDMTGVQATDLWGGFVNPVASATQRYPVDAVAVIRADSSGLRWTLYDQTPQQLLQSQQQPIQAKVSGEDAMALVIDQISDYFANQHASPVVSGESAGMIAVQFNQMSDASSFFNLERQLTQFSSTAKAEIAEVRGDTVIVRVYLIGSVESFKQEVLKSGMVELESESIVAPLGESNGVSGETSAPALEGQSSDSAATDASLSAGETEVNSDTLPVSENQTASKDVNGLPNESQSSGLVAVPSLIFNVK
ncbi:DUF2066 domain-containing protein [Vibrio hippocampi]|uniref:DUF2066 domain-containing protein n=1 Tax=Vibrio hippocampi TaxID=654686 RepID=A0ABM8ZH22_9VIBR|nr:DUF2066 domain-containing protein [Vibrio hippocampi]CAH0524977.1 hypothetical protein VHP8226_00654 [Vibrio hippocampi]